MHALLEGKKGLILGVANANSLAWAIARGAHDSGARLGITYQGERFERRVRKLVDGAGIDANLYACDATAPGEMKALFEDVERDMGTLDFILHAWAFAPKDALSDDFIETSWDDFAISQRVSAYSLVEVARGARGLLKEGASVVALSYLGSQRVVPGYNTMGVAKASLEAGMRYLARDLGPRGVRVNAVSPGPVNTLSARGVSGFSKMLENHEEVAPLKRNIEPEEVAGAAVFLFSDLASGITGEVLYVDAGYHIMGV